MNHRINEFEINGFVILQNIISNSKLIELIKQCEVTVTERVGTRNLLEHSWARVLAEELKSNSKISLLLADSTKVVQCTYFSKDIDSNWSVTLHRDHSIPVAKKIDSKNWSGWSRKEGVLYAQPPRSVLVALVAIRVHLEDNDENNGALRVVPGSHQFDCVNTESELCHVNAGGVLVLKPLILHKSSKLRSGTRRVLHFVFGPQELPDGARWS